MSSEEQEPQSRTAVEREKSRSWTGGRLALRLNRRAHHDREQPEEPPVAIVHMKPPRSLRLLRALVGAILLVIAWASLMATVALFQRIDPGMRLHALQPGLMLAALGEAIAGLWFAFVALTCLITGAFSLSLAITRRGW